MGLDMYLTAERHVSGYSIVTEEERQKYVRLLEIFGVEEAAAKDSPGAEISFTVGYWRKANQIHNWFVQTVQEGVDECQKTLVEREQLEQLANLCTSLIAGRASEAASEHTAAIVSAAKTLPPASGFFFGSTEIDEWYWADIESTVEIIDRALKLPNHWHFYYQSSW